MPTHQPGYYRDILRRIIEQTSAEDDDEPDVVADFEDHLVAAAERALERLQGYEKIVIDLDPGRQIANVEIRYPAQGDRHHALHFWIHVEVQGRGEDDRTQGVALEIYPAGEGDRYPVPWDDDTARKILAGIPGINADLLRFGSAEVEHRTSFNYFNVSALQGDLLSVFRELMRLRIHAGEYGFAKLASSFHRA